MDRWTSFKNIPLRRHLLSRLPILILLVVSSLTILPLHPTDKILSSSLRGSGFCISHSLRITFGAFSDVKSISPWRLSNPSFISTSMHGPSLMNEVNRSSPSESSDEMEPDSFRRKMRMSSCYFCMCDVIEFSILIMASSIFFSRFCSDCYISSRDFSNLVNLHLIKSSETRCA